MTSRLFDSNAVRDPHGALSFITNIVESSTEYSMIGQDLEGTILVWNEGARLIYGYEPHEVLGRANAAILHTPEDVAQGKPREIFDAALRDGKWEGTLDRVRKSGQRFKARVVITPLRGADGPASGYLLISKDITGEINLTEVLKAAQFDTRSLIESNIDLLTTTDTRGIITDVNRQMCEITGRRRDELIGAPFKDYFTDSRRAEDGVRLVLSDGLATNYELTIRAKDGKETVVSYNATIFRGADGHLRGVFASARDITDQKRLEEQIRHQNRQLIETTALMNNVLDSSTEYSIIALDLRRQFLTWNEGARRNYGYTSEEMVGKQSAEVLHTPDDVNSGKVRAFYDTALQTGKAEGVAERVRKNGQRFTAAVAITLRKDADGSPIGYVLISKDITEQKLLEGQLLRKNEELEEQYRRVQEANRLKSEFLANMSHELRTPLNGIIGFAELMHDGKVGQVSDEQKEYLGDILTSSKHLLQLINDVLDLAKVESGKMEIRPEPVDLGKVIAETRDILRTLAARKRIRVKVEVDPTLTDVMADSAKLKQVLYNYLSNALKFTPDEGQVAIRVQPEGDAWIRLEVVDSGIGIRAEDVPRLFIEFQQLDAGAAKKFQGTGLGLALTKRIVEAHGGFVGVTSVVGRGSTFYAVLPRIIQPSPTESAGGVPAPRAPVAGVPTILVVEDDPGERDWLTRTLSTAGYEVAVAATGAEAIQKVRVRAFDAITLDLLLPDSGGGSVLKALRLEGPNQGTPVVIVTVMREQGIGIGFPIYDILTKPVEEPVLLAALSRVVDHDARGRTVLVVDDDLTLLKLWDVRLRAAGYQPVCVPDAERGLRATREENPAAIVLDLLLPGMDGFTFLQRFRRTDDARRVPIIISTSMDLSVDERAQILSAAQGVVLKGSAATTDLLDEIRILVRPSVEFLAASS